MREDPATTLTILANRDCPHCVQAVDHLTDWALEEGLAVAGLDLCAHPEAGAWFEAETSPVLVFQARTERVFLGLPTHAAFHQLARGENA